jgi:4-aminobutyrate aminotransferase-like enzyme
MSKGVIIMDSTVEKILALKDKTAEYAGNVMIGGGTRGGPVLHHGKGVKVWDINGKEYIDCTSQSWALYLGHCNEELWTAVDEYARYLTHVHQGFDTLSRFYLAKKLAEIAPRGMSRISFVPSSALALEGAMKIAIKNRPDAKYFVSLWDGYHGTTLGTMGASWISTKSNGAYIGGSRFLQLTQQTVKVPNPYCYRCYFGEKPESCKLMCAKMLELTLEKGVNGPAAGLIIEPLMASGGMIPCPQRYLKRVKEICENFGVHLIFDEIQTYMRIGKMTAAEYYDVTPDMIALGKAVGGGLPLGVTIIRDGLKGFEPDAEELHTFANANLSQVAAAKLIEIVQRDHLLDNVNKMGKYFKDGLVQLQQEFPEIGDIRQAGLHIGIEMVIDPVTKKPLNAGTKKIRDEAMNRGVILGLAGVKKNVLKIKPPLIINKSEADQVLTTLRESLEVVLHKEKCCA